MAAGNAHLSIDIASAEIAAMLWRHDTLVPVLLDGQPAMPHGVYVDPDHGDMHAGAAALAAAATRPDRYLSHPLQHLGGTAPDGAPDPVELVAALLRHVAGQASIQAGGPITALTLVVPPNWGPRRRALLSDAANQAGMPPPVMVTAPAALAASLGPALEGACVLVCQADIHPPSLTVLQANGGGYRELATTTVPLPTDIDQALADRALATATDPTLTQRITQPANVDDHHARWTVHQSVRQARLLLASQDRAPVLLPAPRPPTVLTRDDLHTAAQPLTHHLPTAVTGVLATADVAATQLTTVVVRQDTDLAGLVNHVATAVGGAPTAITGQPHAAAAGALHLTGHHRAGPTAATAQLPRARLRVSDITAATIIALGSIALLLQVTLTADVYPNGVDTVRPQYSAAAALAVLAGFAIAHLAPTTWLSGPAGTDPTPQPSTGTLIRRAYLGAAFLGIVTCALYGLAVGAYFGFWAYGPLLRWILIPPLPLAACAVLIAATAPRIPTTTLPQWLHRTRPPIVGITLAAAGILLIQSAISYTPPADFTRSPALVLAAGAALLGIATAIIATTSRTLRIITSVILGLGYAIVVTWLTSRTMIIVFIIVVTWWAIHLTAHTLRLAFPNVGATLRRITGGASTPP